MKITNTFRKVGSKVTEVMRVNKTSPILNINAANDRIVELETQLQQQTTAPASPEPVSVSAPTNERPVMQASNMTPEQIKNKWLELEQKDKVAANAFYFKNEKAIKAAVWGTPNISSGVSELIDRWQRSMRPKSLEGDNDLMSTGNTDDPTSKLLGGKGRNFYHIIKGDKGYYIAMLNNGVVVVKPDSRVGHFLPLVYLGRMEAVKAGRKPALTNLNGLVPIANTEYLQYVNPTLADFNSIIDNKPTFQELLMAFQYLSSPTFYLDVSQSKPVF
jgi:hypothetical protein